MAMGVAEEDFTAMLALLLLAMLLLAMLLAVLLVVMLAARPSGTAAPTRTSCPGLEFTSPIGRGS